MGKLNRFDLDRIVRDYKAPVFFETGTLWGDGVAYALRSAFKRVISAEIIPEIAAKARQRFQQDEKVEIIEADSVSALKNIIPEIDENIIFWLDAHFPGADAGLKPYDDFDAAEYRLPLVREVEVICECRKGAADVLILDDARIYEDGPYENGNVPPDALPQGIRNLDFIATCFGNTHRMVRSFRDEGYILLFPKWKYWKKHFTFSSLITGKTAEPDPYHVKEP